MDVLTNRYDISRTGANLREVVLNAKNVAPSQFGKIFEREVDGDIYAQPLVKTNVNIPNVGSRDVVYVATVNNSLYAFDATSPTQSKPYWHVTNKVLGEPVPKSEVTDLPAGQEYQNFDSKIGIVATPVIDDQGGTIYVVAQSKSAGEHHFHLHAFDLATGREKVEMHSPVEIQASYSGNGAASEDGRIRFRPRNMLNRPGLLLINGVLYLAFTTHLDGEPKFEGHGWIMAYDASSLKQLAAVCTTPDGIQGGVWQSGTGLAAEMRDGAPYPLLYAVVANGSVGGRNFGQSILQLYPGGLLSIKLAFTPADHAYQNDHDLDLCAGPVLLPDLPFVLGCDKAGKCYLVDRSNMRAGSGISGGREQLWRRTPFQYSRGAGGLARLQQQSAILRLGRGGLPARVPVRWASFRSRPGKSTMRAPEKSMPGGMLTLSANGKAADSCGALGLSPHQRRREHGNRAGSLAGFRCFQCGEGAMEQRAGQRQQSCGNVRQVLPARGGQRESLSWPPSPNLRQAENPRHGINSWCTAY